MSKRKPLEGVRVTDFTWIGAGSYTTKILADAGADVIKIESSARIDSLRLGAPYKDGIKGVNRSGYFADRNSSKRSITIDMKHLEALRLVQRLIDKSDVIANNFTPGVMDRFGLGYEAVRKMKPDIIYLSMSMQGATGPQSSYLGYGSSMASVTGFQQLTGMPGREPAGTGTNYPDHVPNPCHAAFAVIAALRHRRRTGEGQRIDFAQTEPMVTLLGPTILDLTVNGHLQEARGNDHDRAAPYGAFRCRGNDRWIAICVMNDDQWSKLCRVLGHPAGMAESCWMTEAQRHADRVALSERLQQETVHRGAEDLMQALQAAGVPAGVVENTEDLIKRDPQLAHRGHWVPLDHAEMGPTLYNSPPYRFTNASVGLTRSAPLLGEHTGEVCRELLGMGQEEMNRLAATGVFR